MKLNTLFLLVLLLFFSCRSGIDSEIYTKLQRTGHEVSNKAQATLLANVGMAIQKGGPENAIEFCNLNAASIVDSLSREHNCIISRVSGKNRNPGNSLASASDRELWKIFEKQNLTDTVVQQGNHLVFYKPIRIAMPACLKCHGNPETDINTATKEKLKQLYPKDLATGYQLNDFRGLWKIEFKK